MKIINFFKNIFNLIKNHLNEVWIELQEIRDRGLGPKS